MKFKSLAVCGLSLMLAITPMTASAHEHFHDRGLIFGLVAGTAAVAVAVATLPIRVVGSVVSSPAPAYYGPHYYYNH